MQSALIEGRIFKATILAVDPRPTEPVVEFAAMSAE